MTFCVATGCMQKKIKTGSLSRSERLSKYNQLIRIESVSRKVKFPKIQLSDIFYRLTTHVFFEIPAKPERKLVETADLHQNS